MEQVDVVIIGAGAAGLFCAIEAARRGRQVVVVDHANKAGKKILMSGGGRCNFTNLDVGPEYYLSQNPHFVRSALSRYTQWDFIGLVAQHGIAYHEKEFGQLFCDHSSKDIQQMLLAELTEAGARLRLSTEVLSVQRLADYHLETSAGSLRCDSLVIATGGLSIPTMGASDFGYRLARQFGHHIVDYRASLVPFTWNSRDRETWSDLSGLATPVRVESHNGTSFSLPLLITHRGLSGPAMLQISNYWQPGESLIIDWLPQVDVTEQIVADRHRHGRKTLKSWLAQFIPARLAEQLVTRYGSNEVLAELSRAEVSTLSQYLNQWEFTPGGTEGYRTAEVTLGGVSTDNISSKTLESQINPGLYFIGEVLDVTGWLGGYNFQWAWASAWAAGQVC
ncbi:MAG: NAD(P)/FAD-dependent oxidoreductase [Reinekea sp.]|jgi:predicted Rossmann fold flavoprotein